MISCAKSVEHVWYHEGWIYWLLGRSDCLVLEHSLYDACFCTSSGGDGCTGTETLRTDEVYDNTLGASSGWGATTVYCGVNSDGNVGLGERAVSVILMDFGAGMARLRSVAIF